MKKSKRLLSLMLAVLLLCSLMPVAASAEKANPEDDYPFVFVHGLMGWGDDRVCVSCPQTRGRRMHPPLSSKKLRYTHPVLTDRARTATLLLLPTQRAAKRNARG